MPLTFKNHKLSNGLRVIAECNDAAHTAAVGFFVKTGARDEDAPLMGVSHFLEHMMFKGTDRRSADDVNREFDEIGADYNAYTSHEQTVYYAQVLPEYLPRAVDLLGDILRPALRTDDFEMEKNVILEEIGMYDDRPQWRLQDTLLELYFPQHPLGFRVLGTNDTVKQLTAEQMRDYFSHRYSADNIVVSAAGKIDFDALVKDIEKLTSEWQPSGAQRRYDAPPAVDCERSLTDKKLSRHYMALMCPGPNAQDDRRYAAKVLADVLGDAEGSRIYWALVDPGEADEADLSFIPYDQAGGYMAYASCDPDKAAQVEAKLLATIDAFARDGDVADDEIERAKNKLATQVTLQSERPGGRMRDLGTRWQYLQAYATLEDEIERLMAVSGDDVRQLLVEFPFSPRTIVRLGPNGIAD
ncbi:M16 family metallopeptidase [Phycisphaerales bacterium AB-hyl4]|uniref:M16 family metallopeptidase n=1 Tax=Natronomicrosphaera hydrolytica TaxID=3242702 RepID=A0ABV4TZD2_9BACT